MQVSFRTYGLLLLFLAVTVGLHSQSNFRILNQPLSLVTPSERLPCDPDDRNLHRENVWAVISDRADNPTYTSPNAGASKRKVLDFKDGPFFVIEQNTDWIHIVRGNTNLEARGKDKQRYRVEGEDYGWIRKCNMLLWNAPLNTNKNIPKRTLILNRADAVRDPRDGMETVDIQSHPTRPLQPQKIRIYDFYSVLKVDKTGDETMYLLSKDWNLVSATGPKSRDIDNALVGWVSSKRCTDWNTRMCLEANFEEKAFQDRRQDTINFRVRAYDNKNYAREHGSSGRVGPVRDVVWDDDPVILKQDQLVGPAYRRMLGQSVRMPLLGQSLDENFYYTGVISDVVLLSGETIDQPEFVEKCEQLRARIDPLSNVNILFAVQGTYNMSAYREQILAAIPQYTIAFGGDDVQLRYGAVVYRNVFDSGSNSQPDRLLEVRPLTPNRGEVEAFLTQVEMDNWAGDPDANYPAFTYSLSEAINNAGFNNNETNIIVVIGANGDFQFSKTQRQKYPQYATSFSDLIDQVTAIQAQVFFHAMEVDGRSGRNFLDMGHRLISGSAAAIYNDYIRNQVDGERTIDRSYVAEIPDEIKAGSIESLAGRPCSAIFFPDLGDQNIDLDRQSKKIADAIREQVVQQQ
ncbi:MAG: type VI secretion system protein TssR domain-containing protein, partial [Bacteroidota bacterium]